MSKVTDMRKKHVERLRAMHVQLEEDGQTCSLDLVKAIKDMEVINTRLNKTLAMKSEVETELEMLGATP